MSSGQDISKQVYKFQEGLTKLALMSSGVPEDQVFWPVSHKPDGVSVDVDVVIGLSETEPNKIISLKHITSGKNSETQFWRMVREVIDTKSNAPNRINIYNIIFDHSIKKNLSKILGGLFDGQLIVEDKNYGHELIKVCYNYTKVKMMGLGDEASCKSLEDSLNSDSLNYDPHLAILFNKFKIDVQKCLSKNHYSQNTLWPLIKEYHNRQIDEKKSRITSLKRGLAKFLIFDEDCRRKVYNYLQSGQKIKNLPEYLEVLELVCHTIGGFSVKDPDIIRLFDIMSKSEIEGLINAIDAEKTKKGESILARMTKLYIDPIRQVGNVKNFYQYIYENYETLVKPEGMINALRDCQKDPLGMLSAHVTNGKSKTLWVFTYMMELIKAMGKTKQSYGLALLGRDTGYSYEIGTIGGTVITPWVNLEKDLDKSILDAIGTVFAAKLKTIKKEKLPELMQQIQQGYIDTYIENKLIPYRLYDPIGILFKKELNKEGISYIDIPAYPSCLKEYSNANVGATSEVVEIQTHPPAIVLWQSPNKNPRDKCKEFSGRIAMHINTWNSKSQVFEKRNINAYMILDGKWSDKDIQELLRFGFNNVFYVDEIPKLIDEIKTLVPEDISPLIERVNAVAAENRTKKTVHPIIKKVSSKLLTDFDRRKFLDSLNETEFEKLMLHCYSQQGFSGKLTPVTGDGGIDIDMLDISKDGERWLVQCKKYSKNIPIRDIRDFMGTLSREGVKFGVFAATSNFTSGADRDIKKAKKKAGIEVILLNRESILEKMRDVYTVPEVTYDMVLKVKFEW